MQENRPKLALRLEPSPASAEVRPIDVIHQAIANHVCIRATYNRGSVILAPHILYEWQGQTYVDAVVLERSGERPSEPVLETFKVAGLHAAVTISEPVTPSNEFNRSEPRYQERTVAAL